MANTVDLWHPELGVTKTVPASTAHILAKSGWRPADEKGRGPRRLVQAANQFLASQIASPPADVQPGPEGAATDPPKEG